MRKVRVAIDACLSGRLVGVLNALYGDHGFEFTHVNDLAPAGTADIDWADAFSRFGGRIVISGDSHIAYRPNEAVAFIENGFQCFFPGGAFSRLRGHEQAAVIVHAWPSIRAQVQAVPGPGCFRFPCDGERGKVRLVEGPMTPLQIPAAVLKKHATARQGQSRSAP